MKKMKIKVVVDSKKAMEPTGIMKKCVNVCI